MNAAGSDEWVVDDESDEKLQLYVDVADPMRSAARRGIRSVIRRSPSEHDVEDVVLHAFKELWAKDLASIGSPTAMGCEIAYRRGQDRGDRVLREQRRTRPTNPDSLPERAADDVVDEASFALLAAIIARCMKQLTVDQRAVIEATIAGRLGEEPVKLADWAAMPTQSKAKTYEAWRRQRDRGVASLTRCVDQQRKAQVYCHG